MLPLPGLPAPSNSISEHPALKHWLTDYFDPVAALYGLAMAVVTVGFVLYCMFRPLTIL
jgi:hypothetical protein